jgi:hypothetical protein
MGSYDRFGWQFCKQVTKLLEGEFGVEADTLSVASAMEEDEAHGATICFSANHNNGSVTRFWSAMPARFAPSLPPLPADCVTLSSEEAKPADGTRAHSGSLYTLTSVTSSRTRIRVARLCDVC